MDYKDYEIEDFLADAFFVAWVKKPDAASEHFWSKWLEKHPEKLETVAEAKSVISGAQYKYTYQPTEKDYLDILEKVHQRKHSPLYKLTNSQISAVSPFMKVAAAVAVLFTITSLVYFTLTSWEEEKGLADVALNIAPDTILRVVPNGQKLLLTLPDNSEVKINSGSRIWFSKGFAKEGRTVFLEGEAFFNVTKDSLRPFKVISKGVTTQVLGTAFNVRAYPEQSAVKVIVEHGKVKAGNNAKDTVLPVLTRGDMATFEEGEKPLTTKVDLSKELSWKNNVFLLERATFQEAIVEMEKWYGVSCIVPNDLNVTGRLSCQIKDPSLKDVLDGLGFSSKFQYHIAQDSVWFYPKKTPM